MPRRRLTDAERDERRQADRQRSRDAIDRLRSSEGWRQWLAARRHFRVYSLTNQLLIAIQRPDATRVAGFRAWLKLGYAVRRGERAIRIWVPMSVRDRDADDPYARKTIFKTGAVFDHAQVDPMPPPAQPVPLDPPIEAIEGNSHAHLIAPLTALARELGVTIAFEAIPDTSAGSFNPRKRAIVVDDSGPVNGQVATLIHKLAHALCALEPGQERPELSYAQEELVVESVAYTVTGAAGLDVSGASIPYLTSWSEEAPIEVIEQTAGLIDRLARRIEEAIGAIGVIELEEGEQAA